jgi:HAD superfamily hydrolase (TIGR01549 family)
MNYPQAIVFDYGDTILKITSWNADGGRRAVYERARNPRGVSFDVVAAFADRIVEAERTIKDISHAEFHMHGFHRLLYDRFGITFDATPAELERVFWDAAVGHELTEGFVEMLDALAARDLTAAIVSNATFTAAVLEHELRRYGIADRFAFTMSSAEYNIAKPNELLYETAMGRLDLPAEAIWFVGDRCETDVAGANAVGMTSVWYTGAIQRERTAEPDLSVETWSEMIDAIDACAATVGA